MANKLRKALSPKEWSIVIIEQHNHHYYQPGFLLLPFDSYKPEQLKKPVRNFIPEGVLLVHEKIERIDPQNNQVHISGQDAISYDVLIIATGCQLAPEEVPGMGGEEWHKTIFDFYTFDGALKLRDKLASWEGGKLVVHVTEMPLKCPVAPLEFAFLADSFFREKGIREKVDITYVTPMSGAFTKPRASRELSYLLESKNISIVPDFAIERVDVENKKIRDYVDKEVEYDLLVTVPTNMGDPMMERSGIGDELNYVPTDKHTLQSKVAENIFVIGDASDLPAAKAGSVAHFQGDVLAENILSYIRGEKFTASFDGHANCFIETGDDKALMVDFNYDQEPVPGTYPVPALGPFSLLKESRMNHLGKLGFKWLYWNMILPGRKIPFIKSHMSRSGKDLEEAKN